MRTSLVAAATALTVVAAGVITGVAVTARPATAALGDVPADCKASTAAYRTDGQRLTYEYAAGGTNTKAYRNDSLPWVPSAFQQMGGAGDDTHFRTTEFAAHPTSGWLFKVIRQGELVDGTWSVTEMSASHLMDGFGGTRILAYGYPYLYRAAGNYLYRYTVGATDGVPKAKVRLAGTAWDTVTTLTYERTEGTGDAAVDVLIGTKTNGELKEWRIKRATPTGAISSTVLKSAYWDKFTSLSTGYCQDHPNGRPLLGITSTGAASVHFDANKTDRSGTDIKGGSLGSLGWTAKAYGQ
ncbi:hypothetical protein [Kribbella sp. NPDC003557]|uniref:hypothetical protein n=1 Tax=Kribbella sp. NPDC003557 TaxID=3154449 RepID=UPI0033BE7825